MKKKTLLLLSFSLLHFCASAQTSADSGSVKVIHGDGKIFFGKGTKGSFGGACNMYLSNNITLGIEYNGMIYRAADVPDNYVAEDIFSFSPKDQLHSVAFLFGAYETRDDSAIRFVIQGGPAYINYKKAVFTPLEPENNMWGDFFPDPSHALSFDYKSTMGLYLDSGIELCMTKHIGMAIHGFVNLNEFKTVGGVKFALVCGDLR